MLACWYPTLWKMCKCDSFILILTYFVGTSVFQLIRVLAQEFKPLSPAPLTMSRSMDLGMTVTVKPDVKSGSRHVETVNSELDIREKKVVKHPTLVNT